MCRTDWTGEGLGGWRTGIGPGLIGLCGCRVPVPVPGAVRGHAPVPVGAWHCLCPPLRTRPCPDPRATAPRAPHSTELLYLGALLSWRQKGNREDSVKALDATVQQLVEQTKEMVPSFGFYATFNPQFLLEIIREYLQHCPTEPSDPTDPPSPYTEKALKPLELLVKNVPGSIEVATVGGEWTRAYWRVWGLGCGGGGHLEWGCLS